MTTRFIRTLLNIALVIAFIAAALFATSAYALRPQQVSNTGTVIAYIKSSRDNQAIYMANPDGSNEREVWRVPRRVLSDDGIGFIAWSPQATEIAFDSGHLTQSLTIRDIYTVKPNGTDLRRITNAPHPSANSAYPKGKVAISVFNSGVAGQILQAYVEGAAAPIQWDAAGGTRRDVLFEDVADFGDGVKQYAVVKTADNKCFYDLVAYADVQAGQTVRTVGDLRASEVGPQCLQPFRPAWTADGQQLGFLLRKSGTSRPQNDFWMSPAVNVPLANKGREVFPLPAAVSNEAIINFIALGPTPAQANTLLYDYQNLGISSSPNSRPQLFKAPIDDPALAEEIVLNIEDCPLGAIKDCKLSSLAWLPDGSGFVFSLIQKDFVNSNNDVNFLYRYTFANQTTSRITALGNGIITDVTISPDMQKIAYARALNVNAAFDVWVIGMDGGNNQKIVTDARSPAWSPKPPSSNPSDPTPTPNPSNPTPTIAFTPNPNVAPRVYLPLAMQSSQSAPAQPTATPTLPAGQPTATPTSGAGLINGNFDLGRGVGWQEYSPTGGAIISASTTSFVRPRSGAYVAFFMFGSTDGGTREISQTVQVPANATTLTFYYRWDSQDQTCSGDVARAFVGTGGARQNVWTRVLCSQEYEGSAWFPVNVNVAAYAGQTVALVFQLQTNTTGQSTFAIDDVSLGAGGAVPTSTPTTPPGVTATPTPAASPSPTSPPQNVGISGRVTSQGSAVNNITIGLIRQNSVSGQRDIVATTKTNSNGQYLFPNVATLRSPDVYVVIYYNGIDGGNTDNPNYLAYWRSFAITTYNLGSAADGGSFDIADVKLTSPADNAALSAPLTFSWASRGVAGDAYAWAIATLPVESSYEICRSAVLTAPNYELNQRTYSDCSLTTATVYGWYVYVGKADGSAYGQSHDFRRITFNPPT
jgi:hypothetical protein